MPTTILLFYVERYDENFGSGAQIKDFKAAKRQ